MELEEIFNQEFEDSNDDLKDDLIEETPEKEEDPLFSYLKNLSIIEVDDDFEYDGEESLSKALDLTKNKREEKAYNDLMGKLPEDFKSLLEYGLSGGNSLEEYMKAYISPSLEDLDLDEEENQEMVLRQNWKETSTFSKEKIDKMIDKLKVSGSLKDAAEEALQELNEIKEQRKTSLISNQKQKIKLEQEEIQRRARDFNEKFESYSAPKERKEKIQDLFQVDETGNVKFNSTLNTIKSNYEHLLQLSDLFVDYDPKTGFNLDRFVKRAKSEKTQGLREILESRIKETKQQIKGSPSPTKNDNFDFEQFINL